MTTAPDLVLHTPEGEACSLRSLWEASPYTLLVFLRHLG